MCRTILSMLAVSLLSGTALAAPDYGKRALALEPAMQPRLLGRWTNPVDGLVIEINSITKKNFDVTSIDVTTLTSPNATEEMIPGLMKPGTVDITGNFIGDVSQTQFNTLAQNQTVFYFQMTAPMQKKAKTYTATGQCFVLSYETGPFEPNQKISFKATLQITGFVTETIA